MTRRSFFFWIALLAATSTGLACSNISPRRLQSISVSPATADAQSAPNGQVQFTATGTYNTQPITVTPLQANWGTADQNGGTTTAVTINANGLAQCAAGASGVYSIGAWDLIDTSVGVTCASVGPFGEPGCNAVLGTAQLTCP